MARDFQDSFKVLVLGNVIPVKTGGDQANSYTNLTFEQLQSLDREQFERYEADLVVSPIMTHEFDCLEVGETLQELRFRGRYVVVAENLPNPRMIAAELSALCPNVKAEVLPNFNMLVSLLAI